MNTKQIVALFAVSFSCVWIPDANAVELPPPTRSFSLRPAPLHRTKSFLIGEVGLSYRLSGESRFPADTVVGNGDEREIPLLVSGNLGWMTNLDARNALGASAYFGASGDSWRLGADIRYRRWLSPKNALDLGPGLLLIGGNSTSAVSYPSLASQAGLTVNEWLGILARVEIIGHSLVAVPSGVPTGETWTEVSYYVGARLGGYPGLVVGGTAAIIYGLIQAAIAGMEMSGY